MACWVDGDGWLEERIAVFLAVFFWRRFTALFIL
jgi:hypothetical protein